MKRVRLNGVLLYVSGVGLASSVYMVCREFGDRGARRWTVNRRTNLALPGDVWDAWTCIDDHATLREATRAVEMLQQKDKNISPNAA